MISILLILLFLDRNACMPPTFYEFQNIVVTNKDKRRRRRILGL